MTVSLAASGLPLWGFGLIALLSALGVIAAAYHGLQSLKQAAVLRDVVPYGQLEGRIGQSVAVSGRPRLGGHGHYLWQKTTTQEYRRNYSSSNRGGSRGSWHTVSTNVDANDFALQCRGGEVSVRNSATEVHGTRSTTDYDHGGGGGGLLGGLLSAFVGRRTRTIRESLPVSPQVTVCGRIVRDGSGLALVNDPQVGMLLTSASPGTAAMWESVKGWGSVVVLPLLWVILIGYFVRQYYM